MLTGWPRASPYVISALSPTRSTETGKTALASEWGDRGARRSGGQHSLRFPPGRPRSRLRLARPRSPLSPGGSASPGTRPWLLLQERAWEVRGASARGVCWGPPVRAGNRRVGRGNAARFAHDAWGCEVHGTMGAACRQRQSPTRTGRAAGTPGPAHPGAPWYLVR